MRSTASIWRSLQLENRAEKFQHRSVGGGGRGVVADMDALLVAGIP